jgi:hypothetical protein
MQATRCQCRTAAGTRAVRNVRERAQRQLPAAGPRAIGGGPGGGGAHTSNSKGALAGGAQEDSACLGPSWATCHLGVLASWRRRAWPVLGNAAEEPEYPNRRGRVGFRCEARHTAGIPALSRFAFRLAGEKAQCGMLVAVKGEARCAVPPGPGPLPPTNCLGPPAPCPLLTTVAVAVDHRGRRSRRRRGARRLFSRRRASASPYREKAHKLFTFFT